MWNWPTGFCARVRGTFQLRILVSWNVDPFLYQFFCLCIVEVATSRKRILIQTSWSTGAREYFTHNLKAKMEADGKPIPNFQSTFKYVNNAQCLAIGIALPAVCELIVALRFWTRRKQKARKDLDDWLILVGLLWVCAMGVCFIIGMVKEGSSGKSLLIIYQVLAKRSWVIQRNLIQTFQMKN